MLDQRVSLVEGDDLDLAHVYVELGVEPRRVPGLVRAEEDAVDELLPADVEHATDVGNYARRRRSISTTTSEGFSTTQ